MRVMAAAVVILGGLGVAAAPARAQAQLDSPQDTVEKVLADLEAIDLESRRYPDAAVGDRIRKLVERARGRLQKLGTGRAPAAASAAPAPPGKTAPSGPTAAGPPVTGGRPDSPPPQGGPPSSGGPITDKELRDVIRALKAQSLDGARLGVIQNAIGGGARFTSQQVAQLVHWMTSNDMRVEAAVRLYPRCTDPAAYASVYAKLDGEEARKQLKERIEAGGK